MGKDIENFSPLQYTLLNWLICLPALLITILRLIIRYRQMHALHSDDLFAVAGAACLLAMAVISEIQRDGVYLLISLYAGKTPPGTSLDMLGQTIIRQLKLQFAFVILFWTCLWSVKGSLMMFYRRLLIGLDGHMKWWWTVVIICILTYLVSLLTNFLACLPLSKRFTLDAIQCPLDISADVTRVATTVDVVTDVLVMALPIRLLFGLRISVKQKIGIGCIFSLGLIVIVFSVVRLLKVVPLITGSKPAAEVSLACWSMVESSIAVFTANLPPLKSLISSRRKDTSYDYSGTATTRSGKPGKPTSQSTMGPAIRLHDMSNTVQSNIRGGFDSDVELNQARDMDVGISKTQEIEVTFETKATDHTSIESFHLK